MAFRGWKLARVAIVGALVVLATPPGASGLNALGCGLVHAGLPWLGGQVFKVLIAFNNTDAMNNLGVLKLRRLGQSGDCCDQVGEARSLFDKAIARRHVVARYNLAWSLPAQHESPDHVIRHGIRLLQEAISMGDPHAGVLLAKRLYFQNRDRFVEDREGLRLKLFERAAASGDVGYRHIYARELIDIARTKDDGEALRKAIPHLLAAHQAGDMRAAHNISWVVRDMLPNHPEIRVEEVARYDAIQWAELSAALGFTAAKCRVGMMLFTEAEERTDDEAAPMLKRALPHLEACAAATRDDPNPSPPFGAQVLYAGKPRPTASSLVNSPGWASMHLGDMYASGRGVPRDIARAREHFRRAEKVHGFTEAAERLQKL